VEFSRPVRHIHGDPFSMSSLEQDLAQLRFDVTISNYGRLRHIARIMAGRCDRFIGITGGSGYLGFADPAHNPEGLTTPISVDTPLYNDVADEKTYSLKDFLKLVIRGLGVEVEVVPIDHPIAFNLARDYSTPPYHLMFDIAKTIYELGYRDLVPTPEGVKRSAQWLADNPTITDTEVAKGFGNFYSHNIKDRLIETYQRSMNKINKTLTPPLPH